MFITFEGLDSSGKTTQAKLLAESLRNYPLFVNDAARIVHFIREPGGTQISEQIREMLLNKANLEMTDIAEILLFSAARAQLVREIIKPALERGETVLADRYYDSTTAYQGHGRGLDLHAVHLINSFATDNIDPHLTILVDIPVDELARRKKAANLDFDRMENSGRQFYERVRNSYLQMAANQPTRWFVADGQDSIEEIARTIWKTVVERMHKLGFSVEKKRS